MPPELFYFRTNAVGGSAEEDRGGAEGEMGRSEGGEEDGLTR
jgi:hypothetical protein